MLAFGLLAFGSSSSTAHADDAKQGCSSSYEQTQAARKQGKLSVAREKAILCSQDACPAFIRVDCAQWFSEIDASAPTLVLDARDPTGAETSAVHLLIDGKLVKEKLDGNAIVLDPGEHMLRLELAGAEPKELRVLAREGEKNRRIVVVFTKLPPPTLATPGALPGGERATESKGGAPVTAYVLGGVGLVGGGLFATFGILGKNAKSDLVKTCAPNCTLDQVASVRAKLIAADVSLGVGVISLGVATYLFVSAPPVTRSSKSTSSIHWSASPIPGGAIGAAGGTF